DYASPTVIGPQDRQSAAALSPLSASQPTNVMTSSGAPHYSTGTGTVGSGTSVTAVAPAAPTRRTRELSAVLPAATVSNAFVRHSTHSSAPKHPVLPAHPTMRRQSSGAMRVLILVAIALLLAVGMYILVRPS